MLTTTSADGTMVRAVDDGHGPTILVLHPGLDDGRSWQRVAARLAARFRVVRLHRRQYRLDRGAGTPCSMAQEVEDVLAITGMIGEPVLVVGHSSGGVVALEALAAAPSAFAGAVLYEPPATIGPPLGGDALVRARDAHAAGKPATAITVFLSDVVRYPRWAARLAGALVAVVPRWRALIPHQLDDVAAIDDLGVRLDTYARIEVPVVLLGGSISPAHLDERMDALAHALPNAEKVVLRRQGHGAHQRAPGRVARVIENLASTVLT